MEELPEEQLFEEIFAENFLELKTWVLRLKMNSKWPEQI